MSDHDGAIPHYHEDGRAKGYRMEKETYLAYEHGYAHGLAAEAATVTGEYRPELEVPELVAIDGGKKSLKDQLDASIRKLLARIGDADWSLGAAEEKVHYANAVKELMAARTDAIAQEEMEKA